jgi:integrase
MSSCCRANPTNTSNDDMSCLSTSLAVAERLGHSSVRTTADVYTHALRGQDDDAARRWDEFQRHGAGDTVQRKLQ